MTDILRIATTVGTPLALLGLIVAVGCFIYSRRLKHLEKKLELLPAEERAKAVDQYLTRYNIDGSNLTRDQKVGLIQDEMEKRYRLARLYALVAAAIFLVSFLLATLAYALRPTFPPPGEAIRDIELSVVAKVPEQAGFEGYHKRVEPLLQQPKFTKGEALVSASNAGGQPLVWVWVFKDAAKVPVGRPLSGNEGDLRFLVIDDPFLAKKRSNNGDLEGILLNYKLATKELQTRVEPAFLCDQCVTKWPDNGGFRRTLVESRLAVSVCQKTTLDIGGRSREGTEETDIVGVTASLYYLDAFAPLRPALRHYT